MKKLILMCLFVGLFAYGYSYDNKNSSGYSSGYNNYVDRGYEKPGDKNYLDMKQDEYIYGKDNSFKGSQPGDKDYMDRQQKYLLEGK